MLTTRITSEQSAVALRVVKRDMQYGADTAKSAWERGVYAYAVELAALQGGCANAVQIHA